MKIIPWKNFLPFALCFFIVAMFFVGNSIYKQEQQRKELDKRVHNAYSIFTNKGCDRYLENRYLEQDKRAISICGQPWEQYGKIGCPKYREIFSRKEIPIIEKSDDYVYVMIASALRGDFTNIWKGCRPK